MNLVTLGGHVWNGSVDGTHPDFRVARELAVRLGGAHHVIGRAPAADAGTRAAGPLVLHLTDATLAKPLFVERSARLARELVANLGPDVVLSTSDALGALVLQLLGRRRPAPAVVQVQGGILQPGHEYGNRAKRAVLGFSMRRAVRHADGVRALNAHIAQQARAVGARGPVGIIGSRVDVQRFRPTARPRAGTPVIGALGGLAPVKNHVMLVDALGHLRDRRVDARLVIAGEGPERETITRHATAVGLADRVELLGRIDYARIPDVLAMFTVFAQPSFSEGEPRALLEAMACAIPAVVSDIPSHRGIVEKERNALLAPATDARAWARHFERLLSDPDLASDIGTAGRSAACAEHDFDQMIERFASFLKEVGACGSNA
jgi:glycosyltransferase involved in cell wall biosynthesis